MQGSSIVVVGSGTSLIGSKLGDFIDQQDAVLRFGGGETCLPKVYENREDVGEKTTHLIQNFNLAALRRFSKRVEQQAGFYFNLQQILLGHRGSHNVVSNCIALKNYNKFIRGRIDTEIVDITAYVEREIKNYSGWLCSDSTKPLFEGDNNSTSGFFAILRLVNSNKFDKIYLCGFDNLFEDVPIEDKPYHFYGSEFETEFGHNLYNESRLVLALKKHISKIKILYTKEPFPDAGKIEVGNLIDGEFQVKVVSA